MARLEVEIIGDSRSLERAYARAERSSKHFNRSIENAGRGAIVASVGFRGLGRAVGFASASFLGAAGFVTAVKAGFDEMLAGQAVAADTAAVIKSTGRIAGVTAGQVSQLATSLQQLSGYDDEAIASAENLILTFTNVRNVAGKGNDIFNQTIKSTLDLSRRFDQDLSTSAVQLGKALQDPVRGVTALRRAGISFSPEQQRLINRLVTTGHVLEAQKIILGEVRRETQGAAAAYGKTMAGQIDILKGNLTNLAGELAQTLNPEVKKLTTQFNKWLANPQNKKKIIDDWTASVHALGVAFGSAAGAVGRLKSAWDSIPNWGGAKSKGLIEILHDIGKSSLFQRIAGTEQPPFTGTPPGLSGPIGKSAGAPPGLTGPLRPGAAPPGTVPPAARRRGVTAAQRNAWFDAMIGRELVDVADISTIKGRIARLKEISAQITARIAVTKDITRKLTLEDQVKSIARDRRSYQEQLGQMAAEARQTRKETKFGWLEFAVERAEASGKKSNILAALKAEEAWQQAIVKHEGRTLDNVRALWETRQKIRDLNKNTDGMAATVFRHYSPAMLAGMLGLGGDRQAMALLAQIGRGGTLPRRGSAFAGAGGTYVANQHFYGITDVTQFENAMTKRGRAKAHNRRGAR